MNCENCKNKPATVFYADDSGARHSLCASCAKILGKISKYDPTDGQKKDDSPFIPEPTLSSLLQAPIQSSVYFLKKDKLGKTVCPCCATALETVLAQGRVGCPECYTVFSNLILPSALDIESAHGSRMPHGHRESIGRARSISELKSQLKLAVESENYELAATLRDKIRKLENVHNT